jgi:hypothetical protein
LVAQLNRNQRSGGVGQNGQAALARDRACHCANSCFVIVINRAHGKRTIEIGALERGYSNP